ncbi:hypothetical protein [Actinokineospora sp. UTMC 2448]|uniref:hypothetical protein n=1 Tax=Actinokineospora sp. UTMC 2448 TaxID=2268449 RepID=UPI002164D757|nr:hypothetical protein [Actinokineospora sp. UTMC 2448]UVS79424.1 hypothetical protein Actkin_03172 [Actinokineospora sp. UTMC 2448]
MTDWWAIASAGAGWVAAGVAVAATFISRRSAKAAEGSEAAAKESSVSAATVARVETDREHRELTPDLDYALIVDNGEAGSVLAKPGATARLVITLNGPHDLDDVTVTIRDDRPGRAADIRTAGGPTREAVAAVIWGPWRFRRGVDNAGPDGRSVPGRPLARLDELVFALDPTPAPTWYDDARDWLRQYEDAPVRLVITCTRAGHEPWIVPKDVPPHPKDPWLLH